MSARRPLDAWLTRARPADPRGRGADASAVRVLARVAAAEETSAGASRGRVRPRTPRLRALLARHGRRAVVAAAASGALAAAGVVLALRGVVAPSPDRDATPSARVAASTPGSTTPSTPASVAAAPTVPTSPIRADAVPSPAEVRARWLATALARGEDAPAALSSLLAAGGPVGPDEARRVASLHDDPALADVVETVLAAAVGDSGPLALAARLVDAPPEEQGALLAALERIGRDGRPALALDGLRRAAERGVARAAVAGVRVGGAGELDRALAAIADAPEVRHELAEAVAMRPRVLGTVVLRKAERGDRAALAVAAEARVDGLVDALRPWLRDEGRASAAVAALATVGGSDAVEALATALGGPADGSARAVLLAEGAAAAPILEAAAARANGIELAAPYVDALAWLGDAGLPSLAALAERPALAARVVRALSASTATGASGLLGELAAREPLARGAVEALSARLAEGDATASEALLDAARGSASRAALGALAGAGPRGAEPLGRALEDPQLGPAAAAALRREGARPREEDPPVAPLPTPVAPSRGSARPAGTPPAAGVGGGVELPRPRPAVPTPNAPGRDRPRGPI